MAGIWVALRNGPSAGEEVAVDAELTLGRDREADLSLDDPGVSRRHALIRATGGGAVVEDLGSSNGTFVNGTRIEAPTALSEGDVVQVGSTALDVVHSDEATEVLGERTEAAPAPAPVPVAPPPPDPDRGPPRPERPPPAQGPFDQGGGNWPALGAIILGPLSIILLVLGSGVAFYASLPIAVAAIALGSAGKRSAAGGAGMRGLAVAGQVFGVVGTILAAIVLLVLVAVGAATDIAADSLPDLIDEIRSEVESEIDSAIDEQVPEGVEVPEGVDLPQ